MTILGGSFIAVRGYSEARVSGIKSRGRVAGKRRASLRRAGPSGVTGAGCGLPGCRASTSGRRFASMPMLSAVAVLVEVSLDFALVGQLSRWLQAVGV